MYKYEDSIVVTHCIECGAQLRSYGRADRKFCSTSCKNRFHNRERDMPYRRYHDKVTRVLQFNYSILKGLTDVGLSSMDMVDLKRMGFNPDYCTSFQKSGRRSRYTCYDIQYDITETRVMNVKSLLQRHIPGMLEEASGREP